MMTCREFCELLLDFVSGELTPEQVQRLNEHMGICPPCVAYLSTYRLTIQLTRRLPSNPLPPPCEQRLRAVVAAKWNEQLSNNA